MSEENRNQTNQNEMAEEETIDDLFEKFSITVPKEEIAKQIDEVAKKYSAEIKLPGFRKGNIPIEIIKSRYKKVIADEALNKVVEFFVYKKIQEDPLRIVSHPVIEKIDYEEGNDLNADVMVEVFPEITLPDLSKIELKISSKELKPEPYDEEKQIEGVLERNKRRVPVKERPVQEDDVLILVIQSQFTDTKRMIKKKEASYVVNKETEFEISDLYHEVLGKKINDEIVLKKKYPSNYERKKWAGKELEHLIVIKNIFEMKNPEFTDEFVKSVGFKDKQSFKDKLRKEYDQYINSQKEDKINSLIIDHLTANIEFPIPRTLVDQEMARIQAQHTPLLKTMEDKQKKEYLDALKKDIEKSVKFSLIHDSIQKEFKINISSDELEKEYKSIAEKNNFPLAEVRKYYMNSQEKDRLKESLLRVRVMSFIKEKIKIKEV
ncbi:MAG: trigger factor [Candidatus Aminicenantes bacterium]|nr:trigger factor [Candidatus Aminicenantes bacterium]